MISSRYTQPAHLSSQPAAEPFHDAVKRGDASQIKQLRQQGLLANQLDTQDRSPLDILDSMRNIDSRSRSSIRMALLESLNNTAPRGHMKPEAFHGTPWGLEVLVSGGLMGGANDKKGGSQSLEGQVFFSDRTRESDGDKTTRKGLRTKPRIYAKGAGMKPSNAFSRALQHGLTQVILKNLDSGQVLKPEMQPGKINVANLNHITAQEAVTWLQQMLHDSHIMKGNHKTPGDLYALGKFLPTSVVLQQGEQQKVLKGDSLRRFYQDTVNTLQRDLENGKAPFLSLLNQGNVVPMVFGFEKINHLSSHSINNTLTRKTSHFSYQSQAHPLQGGPNGGKLKELEVRSLDDLATLCLGCAAKGTALPPGLVVRLKARKDVKAQYLDASKVTRFQTEILRQAQHLAGNQQLGGQPMERLQSINVKLRSNNLHSLV